MLKFPWNIKKSLIFGFGLLLIGFLIEISTNIEISAPLFPNNLILLFVFSLFLIFTHIFFRKNKFITWLSGVNSALSSIIFFAGLTLLMGLIPQTKSENLIIENLGLNRIPSTFTYSILLIYFATSLGLVTIKRLTPINRKNIGFFFNHFGLWLVILSANLGTGDLQQLNMIISESKIENIAYDKNEKMYQMPFSIRLNNFDVEEFNPKLLIYNNTTSEMVSKPYLIDSLKNSFNFQDYKIKVQKFYKYSNWISGTFQTEIGEGNCPSALVEIFQNHKIISKGWVTCGSYKMEAQYLPINSQFTLVMAVAEPKRFFSDISIIKNKNDVSNFRLDVNKPIEIDDWSIYQFSYDQEKGKWSDYAVIQFVKDPWLPVVYFGITLMIIGVGFIIFRGENLKH